MKKTMAYTRWHSAHVIAVHSSSAPTAEEWSAYVKDVEQWLPETFGFLVVTDGGGPTGSQRHEMKAVFARGGRSSIRGAVVSSSLLVRGIVNALNLFNPGIRVFQGDAMEAALAHIGAALDGPAVLAEVEHLRQRLRG